MFAWKHRNAMFGSFAVSNAQRFFFQFLSAPLPAAADTPCGLAGKYWFGDARISDHNGCGRRCSAVLSTVTCRGWSMCVCLFVFVHWCCREGWTMMLNWVILKLVMVVIFHIFSHGDGGRERERERAKSNGHEQLRVVNPVTNLTNHPQNFHFVCVILYKPTRKWWVYGIGFPTFIIMLMVNWVYIYIYICMYV